MQVKTLDDALDLLVKRRVMTLAGAATDRVPSLASAVAGKPVKGSWWAHPQGKLIFKLSEALADHRDVLLTRLGDKVTFVHKTLWAALYRMGTDETQVRATLGRVAPAAADLFAKVQKAGTLHVTAAEKDIAAALEGLVIQTQEHGESGAHRSILRSWQDWAPKKVAAAAKKLTVERAQKQIADAMGWGATSLAPAPVVESKTPPSKKRSPPSRRKRR